MHHVSAKNALISRMHMPAWSMKTSTQGLAFIFRHESLQGISDHLHWPGGSSGVTLGPGYDMKERSRAQVSADMLAIGLGKVTADEIANAIQLTGSAAEDFADDNADLVTLTRRQQFALLRRVVPAYEVVVQRNVTTDLAQHQFDALVSFCYNPGGSFLPVAHAINQGKISDALHIIRVRVITG
ncbi:MAG: lytic transglycosylase domain-containing protein, partial [Gammaproteobacteria bacterium]|nr:lytic transglycosylase domain-containing protein [Gammaproteobacteria bacterium]